MGDTEAFRRALEEAPGSLRELARAAHVSHTLLLRVRDGKRELSDDIAEAVARALSEWSETCAELAANLGQGDER